MAKIFCFNISNIKITTATAYTHVTIEQSYIEIFLNYEGKMVQLCLKISVDVEQMFKMTGYTSVSCITVKLHFQWILLLLNVFDLYL